MNILKIEEGFRDFELNPELVPYVVLVVCMPNQVNIGMGNILQPKQTKLTTGWL